MLSATRNNKKNKAGKKNKEEKKNASKANNPISECYEPLFCKVGFVDITQEFSSFLKHRCRDQCTLDDAQKNMESLKLADDVGSKRWWARVPKLDMDLTPWFHTHDGPLEADERLIGCVVKMELLSDESLNGVHLTVVSIDKARNRIVVDATTDGVAHGTRHVSVPTSQVVCAAIGRAFYEAMFAANRDEAFDLCGLRAENVCCLRNEGHPDLLGVSNKALTQGKRIFEIEATLEEWNRSKRTGYPFSLVFGYSIRGYSVPKASNQQLLVNFPGFESIFMSQECLVIKDRAGALFNTSEVVWRSSPFLKTSRHLFIADPDISPFCYAMVLMSVNHLCREGMLMNHSLDGMLKHNISQNRDSFKKAADIRGELPSDEACVKPAIFGDSALSIGSNGFAEVMLKHEVFARNELLGGWCFPVSRELLVHLHEKGIQKDPEGRIQLVVHDFLKQCFTCGTRLHGQARSNGVCFCSPYCEKSGSPDVEAVVNQINTDNTSAQQRAEQLAKHEERERRENERRLQAQKAKADAVREQRAQRSAEASADAEARDKQLSERANTSSSRKAKASGAVEGPTADAKAREAVCKLESIQAEEHNRKYNRDKEELRIAQNERMAENLRKSHLINHG